MDMVSFERDEAVRRFIAFACEDDEPARLAYRKALQEDYSTEASFLRGDLGLVLEAYANQRTAPASKMPNAVWPCIDHSDFKAEVPHIAHRYTLLPGLWTKRTTDFLCRALLDSEIYPLAREVDNPATVLSNTLSQAFGPDATFHLQNHARGSGWATAGAILLILVAIIFALAGVFVVSAVFLGLAFWIFISSSKKRKAIGSAYGSALAEMSLGLRGVHGQLTLIRDEIAGGSYDGPTIANRLKSAEASGAYVPSIIYRLLEIQTAKPTSSDYSPSGPRHAPGPNGGAPGTVADKVNYQMADHRKRAESLLAGDSSVPPPSGPYTPIRTASRTPSIKIDDDGTSEPTWRSTTPPAPPRPTALPPTPRMAIGSQVLCYGYPPGGFQMIGQAPPPSGPYTPIRTASRTPSIQIDEDGTSEPTDDVHAANDAASHPSTDPNGTDPEVIQSIAQAMSFSNRRERHLKLVQKGCADAQDEQGLLPITRVGRILGWGLASHRDGPGAAAIAVVLEVGLPGVSYELYGSVHGNGECYLTDAHRPFPSPVSKGFFRASDVINWIEEGLSEFWRHAPFR